METETTRDFVPELESGKYDHLKDKHIVTYCTGGIRCEILSVLMKNRGFQHVNQIDGGIMKYGEKYGDTGLWQGKLYVFDQNKTTEFTDQAVDIGECHKCGTKTSNYENCDNRTRCKRQILVCAECAAKTQYHFCSPTCAAAGA